MQQALTVASPTPAASSVPPLGAPSTGGNASSPAATFGTELARLLTAATQPDPSVAVADANTSANPIVQTAKPASPTADVPVTTGKAILSPSAQESVQSGHPTSLAAQVPVLTGQAAASPPSAQDPVATPQELQVASTPPSTDPAADAPASATTQAAASAVVPKSSPQAALPEPPKPAAGKAGNGGTTAPRRTAERAGATAAIADQQPAAPACAQVATVVSAVPDSAPEAGQQPASDPGVVTAVAEGGPQAAPTGPIGGRPVAGGPTDPASSSASATPGQEAPATAAAQPADATPNHAATFVPAAEVTPLPQQATPTAAAPSHSAEPARPASPVAQLTPALVQIGHASNGTQRLTVRLQPPELGQVEVRIDRPHESAARVDITVEKQETLTLLLRDQPQLQRALDQAGVPAEGRSVTFHVASADQSAHSEPATAPAPGVAAGGPSSDGSHGTPRNGGQAMRQQTDTTEDSATESMPVALSGWMRGGLDITA